MKKFNNKPNPCITHEGKEIWISRSCAVAGTIMAVALDTKELYILTSKRGPKAADFIGMYNLTCGYIDWNESGPGAMARELYEETGLDLEMVIEKYVILQSNLDQPWYVASSPNQNRQNITLRYGALFAVDSIENLPKLTTDYNEVVGEVEDPIWMPYKEINNYEWAFNHNTVINQYIEKLELPFVVDIYKGHIC